MPFFLPAPLLRAGGGSGGGGGTPINLTISGNTQNYNLFIAAGSPATPVDVTLTINDGIIVGSSSISNPALRTGTGWHASSTITIIFSGTATLSGKGGNGGVGAGCGNYTGGNGEAGGTALLVEKAIVLQGTGKIQGGGGGGGGGQASKDGSGTLHGGAGGGGGGAGNSVGTGGTRGLNKNSGGSCVDAGSTNGNSGTISVGGSGGIGNGVCEEGCLAGDGGAGGSPGVAGNNGNNVTVGLPAPGSTSGLGGAAGVAVDGNSLVTDNSTITFLGAKIN